MDDEFLARLERALRYDPGTGVFTWLASIGRRVKVGDVVGCVDKTTGFVRLQFESKNTLHTDLRGCFRTTNGQLI